MSIVLKPETTRVEALKHLGEVFREAGIETAQRDARLLLLDATGIAHAELLSGARVPLGDAAVTLADNAARRVTREPVARILDGGGRCSDRVEGAAPCGRRCARARSRDRLGLSPDCDAEGIAGCHRRRHRYFARRA